MRWMPTVVGAGLGILFLAATMTSARAATWSYASFPTPPRVGHGAAVIDGGRVLVAGGAGPGTTINDAVIFNPASRTWTKASPMAQSRALFCLVTLADKRVIAIGGSSRDLAEPLSSVEIWDPLDLWTTVQPLSVARYSPACVLMKDGKVLVAGGAPSATTDSALVEIYDPGSSTDPLAATWTTVAPMAVAKHNPRAVLLPSGEVVVVGGGAIEKFNPTTGVWAPAITTGIPTRAEAVLLQEGTVLVVGQGSPSSVVYDPATNTVAATKSSAATPYGLPRGVTLPNGQVLLVGGVDAAGAPTAAADLYDPKTGKFAEIDPLVDVNALHTATSLIDGRVLVIGAGKTLAMPAEIFNGVDGNYCGRPDDCVSGYCVDSVCCHSPCGGSCEACNVKGSEGTCSPITGKPLDAHASCAPYLMCAAGHCVQSCESDADCTSGTVCFKDRKKCGPDRNLCGPDDSVIDRKTGAQTPCTPYACSLKGACLTACGTSLDCAAGFLCQDGSCVSSASDEPSSGGCATSSPTSGSHRSVFTPLLLIGLLVTRSRRAAMRLVVAAMFAFAIGCDAPPTSAPVSTSSAKIAWSAAGTMQYPVRVFHSATTLKDGRVLVTGGTGVDVLSASELYDPKTNHWSNAARLSQPRSAHDAVLLADGRVLVSGGRDATSMPKPYASSELYDPASDAWTTAPMQSARERHAVVLLKDGRVLAAGGAPTVSSSTSTAEVFDPTTGTWSATSSMNKQRTFASAALLRDGRVLIAAGIGGGTSTEVWDPASGAWSDGPPIAAERVGGRLVRVADAKLVLIGGDLKNVDVLDETTMTWKTGHASEVARPDSPPVLLADGTILLAGGDDAAAGVVYGDYEKYDPVMDQWLAARTLTIPRLGHTASLLASKRVLLVGGLGVIDDKSTPLVGPPEIMNLSDGVRCAAHEECESGFCVDGVCCDQWCPGSCWACNVPGREGACAPVTGTPPANVEDGPQRESCAPFGVCVEGACATSCAEDSYCDKDHVCDVATQSCIEPIATCNGTSVVTDKSSGAQKDCAPFRCTSNGSCLTKCTSTYDCAPGAACDGNTCVTPAPSSDTGGCAVSSSSTSGTSAFIFIAAVLLLRRLKRAPASE